MGCANKESCKGSMAQQTCDVARNAPQDASSIRVFGKVETGCGGSRRHAGTRPAKSRKPGSRAAGPVRHWMKRARQRQAFQSGGTSPSGRFSRRLSQSFQHPAAALRLAAVSLVVIAAGLATMQTASAQSETTIWSATLTVGAIGATCGIGGTREGYTVKHRAVIQGDNQCRSAGSLSRTVFTYGNHSYSVSQLYTEEGDDPDLGIALYDLYGGGLFNSDRLDDLKLYVGSASFAFDDATATVNRAAGHPHPNRFEWENSGLDWSDGDTVQVRIAVKSNPGPVAPTFPVGSRICSLKENSEPGTVVCKPNITATDFNGDTVTYSLHGRHASRFSIDSATAKITTTAPASQFNYEARTGRRKIALMVRATDPGGLSATKRVTVLLSDVFEARVVGRGTDSLTLAWDPPSNARTVAGYDVWHRPVGTPPGAPEGASYPWQCPPFGTYERRQQGYIGRLRCVLYDASDTGATLTGYPAGEGLLPGTEYEIYVREVLDAPHERPSFSDWAPRVTAVTGVRGRSSLQVTDVRNVREGNVSNRTVRITFDRALSFRRPPPSAFTVIVDGERVGLRAATPFAGSAGSELYMRLDTDFDTGDEVRVVYIDPTGDNDDRAIQDTNGLDSASFCVRFVRGETGWSTCSLDVLPPRPTTLTSPSNSDPPRFSVSFNEALDFDTLPGVSQFRARSADISVDVTALQRHPTRGPSWLSVQVARLLSQTEKLELSYRDPSSGDDAQAIQDPAGNDAKSFCLELPTREADTRIVSADAPCSWHASPGTRDEEPGEVFSASFKDVPKSHDGSEVEVELEFTQAPKDGFSYQLLQGHTDGRDGVLEIGNGELEGVERIVKSGENKNQRWRLTITPTSADGDITVTLPATTDCSAVNAICNASDQPLSAAVTTTIPNEEKTERTEATEEQKDSVKLTVGYVTGHTPATEHDGSTAFTFKFSFSEELHDDYSYATMRDHSLDIAQGTGFPVPKLTPHVNRRVKDNNQHWEVKVTPNGRDDIAINLGPNQLDCTDAKAMCTEDGRELKGVLPTRVVKGPPGISVADASVEEATGASVDFTVTMGGTRSGNVTVDYATSDGTAEANADYTAVAGTLTFAPGETSNTVSVPVIDDAVDEGSETFTLTLSNASGGGAYLTDSEATGTITNNDPMPKAWLARFGRTAAIHVLDALEERLESGPGASWMRLGGHRVGAGRETDNTFSRPAAQSNLWDRAADEDPSGRDLTFDQLLLGSAFHLVSNPEETTSPMRLSAWSRVATSGFDGRESETSFDGTVTTATLGVDSVWQRWLTGIAVAYSEGDGTYTLGSIDAARLQSTLTSFHPYAAYELSDRVKLWGMVGYGSGTLKLMRQDALSTDLDMRMGAVGMRGDLLSPSEPGGGLALALRSDALWTQTSSEAVAGLAGTAATTSRLRLVLEASRPLSLAGGGTLTPVVEVGVRHDGGDAETGSGVEVGGRLGYAAAWGLTLEVSLRALVAHEAADYEEWGASGMLRFDPGRQGLGLTAQVAPSWGMAMSGVGQLWSRPDTRGLAARDAEVTPAGHVVAELGYGFPALRGQGLLTPYAQASLLEGMEQAWHLGTRLDLESSLNLSLQATHRQRQDEPAAHELALLATVPW